MKKILFIDNLSCDGHIHSTRAQINALKELGYEIFCAFRKGYISRHHIEGVHNYIEIPEALYSDKISHIRHRIEYTLSLLYVRFHLNEKDWDHIVIQTYEPVSLFLSQSFKGAYIVDQNTVSYVDSPVKLKILKLLSCYKHVVFNEHQRDGLISHGIDDVYVVPIGANEIPNETDKKILTQYSLEANKFIFCPSATSVDHDFLSSLCKNPKFMEFLSNNGIKLVVKKEYPTDDKYKDLVLPLTDYLSEEDYNSLMRYSKFVLLSYMKSFTYRVSGVLLECIQSKIKCLINDMPSFRAYEKYMTTDVVFYSSVDDIIQKAGIIDNLNANALYKPYNSMDSIKNAWIETFNKENR